MKQDLRKRKKPKDFVFLLKAMVAYDELGSLVPIKRTLQVIDYQNQANKESEVSPSPCSCSWSRSRSLTPTWAWSVNVWMKS